ncbi:MAG: trehalose-phosphatase [Pseudomonadota bacterium]
MDITPRPLFDAPPPANAALFLDFDGTLVDIADTPDGIHVPAALGGLLDDLRAATNGAMALVTGRSIRDIERHLPGAVPWIAGCHGGERRTPQGHWAHPLTGDGRVRALQREVKALRGFRQGVITEEKPLGAVVHYRRTPDLEPALHRAAQAIATAYPGFECHPAKMAFELRPADMGKAHVLRAWMQEPPFKGRVPVFLGDDLTDEPALAWVRDAGGTAIKVGDGDSVAPHRLTTPDAVRDALAAWHAQSS